MLVAAAILVSMHDHTECWGELYTTIQAYWSMRPMFKSTNLLEYTINVILFTSMLRYSLPPEGMLNQTMVLIPKGREGNQSSSIIAWLLQLIACYVNY